MLQLYKHHEKRFNAVELGEDKRPARQVHESGRSSAFSLDIMNDYIYKELKTLPHGALASLGASKASNSSPKDAAQPSNIIDEDLQDIINSENRLDYIYLRGIFQNCVTTNGFGPYIEAGRLSPLKKIRILLHQEPLLECLPESYPYHIPVIETSALQRYKQYHSVSTGGGSTYINLAFQTIHTINAFSHYKTTPQLTQCLEWLASKLRKQPHLLDFHQSFVKCTGFEFLAESNVINWLISTDPKWIREVINIPGEVAGLGMILAGHLEALGLDSYKPWISAVKKSRMAFTRALDDVFMLRRQFTQQIDTVFRQKIEIARIVSGVAEHPTPAPKKRGKVKGGSLLRKEISV